MDVDDHGRLVVHPSRLTHVLGTVHHAGDVGKLDRGTVAEADDEAAKLLAREQLIVGADRVGLPTAIEASLGLIHARLHERHP